MPLPMTEMRRPLYVPVYPNILRMVLNCSGLSRYVSAIIFARSGSPGSSTVFAICRGAAPIWGEYVSAMDRASFS